ncbi:nectin-1-like isoform X2 [Heterodontus francisci]|uniref:nectin-1-like isoform X2 n=1 Tax=Heterodontus francisci TaxID=7792 RepID=UPI00355B649E
MSVVALVSFLQLVLSPVVVTQKIKVDSSVTGNAGEELMLPCHFINNDSNLTVVQVTWLKKAEAENENLAVYNPHFGTSYPATTGRITFNNANSQNCTLAINPLELDDEGLYSCEVNVFPTGKQESQTNLTVLAKPMNGAVAVPAEAGLSETSIASCTAANGKPAAVVTWIAKVAGKVTSTRIENPNRTVTVISQYRIVPTRKDNGENVTCVVSHKALSDRVSLPVTLSVRYPPEVTITGYDGNWHLNRRKVNLRCIVEANPPATSYRWTMTTGPVPENARVEGNHLFIRQVDYSVNGTWVCEATNAVGKGKGEIAVVVREMDALSAGESFGSTVVYIVIGTVIGVLFIAVLLSVVIVKKRRTIDDTKPEAKPSPQQQRSQITVFATLNLNVLDTVNSSTRENHEREATINADVNINQTQTSSVK